MLGSEPVPCNATSTRCDVACNAGGSAISGGSVRALVARGSS